MIEGGYIDTPEPTECLLTGKRICSNKNGIELMHKFLQQRNIDVIKNAEFILDKTKQHLGVDSEVAIWKHDKFKRFVGERRSDHAINNWFKPEGPSDSNKLLNNKNIDDLLSRWSRNSQELFGKKFYHIPFQMIDFKKYNTELETLDLQNLINENYDCFGVVLNTDVSTGPGKHWFCIYGTLTKNKCTIEFFNSSGNPPRKEIEVWMKEKEIELRDNDIKVDIVRSAPLRLQYSDTECGVWSLMYIKSRLENKPANWFYKVKADDFDMLNLRKHLFL